ncbi:hypothetical protein GCK72_009477 [Caenorhabditis remanei]|uniref:Tubulin gamma chain n=3 Tax=Caenorhabditis remanei TaxID=31234 RepID=A0A2P4VT98_CAERE|nr:hypothetical protein GCK72_009477 [Caenorhabditis remanei]KAF1761223.1 hypothetical protein GCK72_009477 [Caenorhabditis remanei]
MSGTGALMTVHVGQCGNQLAQAFWKSMVDEHGINERGQTTHEDDMNDKKDLLFYQADDDHYVPRAVLVDLEPRVINGMMQSPSFSNLFNTDNIFMSDHGGGAGNNWASGYFQGQEVKEKIMDIIIREAENTDNLDGILFTHSVSGGTGSGTGSLLLESLREAFPKKVIQTYSVFANSDATGTTDVVVHPYNWILSMQRLIENPDHVVVLDNAALHRLAAGKFKTDTPTFDHINSLVARIMSTSTAMYRFNSSVCPSIRYLDLAPFPPMHFIQSAISPVVDPNENFTRKTSVADVTRFLLKPTSMMVSTASRVRPNDCMLSAYMFLQGQIEAHTIMSAEQTVDFQIKRPPFYMLKPLRMMHAPLSPYVRPQYKVSGLLLNNSTSVAPLFESLLSKYDRLRSKKAFIDKFEKIDNFSLDMMDEATHIVQDLLDEYKAVVQNGYLTRGL